MKEILRLLLLFFFIACSSKDDILEEDLFDDVLQSQIDAETTEESTDTINSTDEDTSDTSGNDASYDSNDFTAISEGQITLYGVDGNNLSKLVDYNVESELLDYQKATEKHQELWNQIVSITPEFYLNKINQFAIFVGDYDSSMDLYETLAYVSPTSEDLSTWQFGIAIDLSYLETFTAFDEELNGTIIHELGHIVVLDDTQINPFVEAESCTTYHLEEGCTKETSYMYPFYLKFWSKIPVDQNAEDTYAAYPNDFLTDYAATNITEDMAETFRYFVLTDEPVNISLVKHQKISEFYGYENFTELRSFIRENVDSFSLLAAKISPSNSTIRCGTSRVMPKWNSNL